MSRSTAPARIAAVASLDFLAWRSRFGEVALCLQFQFFAYEGGPPVPRKCPFRVKHPLPWNTTRHRKSDWLNIARLGRSPSLAVRSYYFSSLNLLARRSVVKVRAEDIGEHPDAFASRCFSCPLRSCSAEPGRRSRTPRMQWRHAGRVYLRRNPSRRQPPSRFRPGSP
jgi:hypothetical protein